MKKILITICDGMVERNLFKTDFLGLFLKNISEFSLNFVTSDEELFLYLKKEYENLPINIFYRPLKNRFVDIIFYHLFQNSIHSETVKENQYNYWKGIDGRRSYSLLTFIFFRILWVLGYFKFWRSFLRFLIWYYPDNYCHDLLSDLKPDIVFITSINSSDHKVLRQARKIGIKSVQMIKSWDNLTSKTFLAVRPDHLIVHNEIIKKEAEIFDDVPASNVFISGIPQFDYLIKNKEKLLLDRKEFYDHLSIDYTKKIILFCASGDWLSPNDKDFILMINNAIRNNKIPKNVHIHVRLHPKYNSSLESIKDLENVTIDRPFTYLSGSLKNWVFDRGDMESWFNSIYHSSVVVNAASTMSIDAAIFDRPVICLGFDGFNTLPYEYSIVRYYDRDHYKNLIKTGGVSLVRSESELITEINKYLVDPLYKSKERGILVEEQCYKIDGQSSLRIFNLLVSLINK